MSSSRQATYTVTINDAQALASLRALDSSAGNLDNSIASINSSLQAFGGLYLGRQLIGEAKEWVQGAADYEQAMLRIKFSSRDLADGVKNQQFILGEVDKFKIPIQEAADAYGKFLAMVGNSDLAGDKVRELHDNLLTVAKIKHVSNAQMDRAVYDLGVLISEPRMDASHLRFLSYALPGIMPYIAKENNITKAELAEYIKKHKTGDLDNQSVIRAIGDMAGDLGGNLPEALTSMQSNLNDVSNAWVKFKNDIVLELKPELLEFFEDLKGGIVWLKEHKDSIESWGYAALWAAGIWNGFRLVFNAWVTGATIYRAFMAGYTADILTETVAVNAATIAHEAETAAVWEKVTAYAAMSAEMEEVITRMTWFNTSAGIGTFVPAGLLGGRMRRGLPGGGWTVAEEGGASGAAAYGAGATEAEIVGGGAAAGTLGSLGALPIVGGALLVGLAGWSLDQWVRRMGGESSSEKEVYIKAVRAARKGFDLTGHKITEDDDRLQTLAGMLSQDGIPMFATDLQKMQNKAQQGSQYVVDLLNQYLNQFGTDKQPAKSDVQAWLEAFAKPDGSNSIGGKIKKPEEVTHIKGNTVTTINIHIDKQVEKIVFQGVSDISDLKKHTPEIQAIVTRMFTDAVNDAQLIHKH